MVYAMKSFLNGKALMLLRRKDITRKGFDTDKCYSYELTVMNLDRTINFYHIIHKSIVFGSGHSQSGKNYIKRLFSSVEVAGKHGNILIFHYTGRADSHRLMMLTFSRFGNKLLSSTDCSDVLHIKSYHLTRASPDSKYLYVCASRGRLAVFEIMHERFLAFRARYHLPESLMRPPGRREANISHIFCYEENKLILLLDTSKKEVLKFMVFSYKEDKGAFVKTKVKNADKFTFKGELSLYRKNGQIYFFDQKARVYQLSL